MFNQLKDLGRRVRRNHLPTSLTNLTLLPSLTLPEDFVPLEGERGDVPGWVMVTLMTAALVVALSALALPALSGLFEKAINSLSIP